MSGKRAWLAVLGIGILGSQAGHLLSYQLRFGAAAQQIQSSGAHAYFPTLAKTGLGAVAAILLGGLLIVGLARVLSRGTLRRQLSGASTMSLLAALFTIQLAWFALQETAEAALARAPANSVADLLLWGTLGQLPIAVIAALALRLLMVRFESSVTEIRAVFEVVQPRHEVVATLVLAPIVADSARLVSRIAVSSLSKRGPPSLMRFSSN